MSFRNVSEIFLISRSVVLVSTTVDRQPPPSATWGITCCAHTQGIETSTLKIKLRRIVRISCGMSAHNAMALLNRDGVLHRKGSREVSIGDFAATY
jgi:hypothetical protein